MVVADVAGNFDDALKFAKCKHRGHDLQTRIVGRGGGVAAN